MSKALLTHTSTMITTNMFGRLNQMFIRTRKSLLITLTNRQIEQYLFEKAFMLKMIYLNFQKINAK